MIARCEKTGDLRVQPNRGRKSTRSNVLKDIATAIVEKSMDNVVGCSNALRCSLQYSEERIQKNAAFLPIQSLSESAVAAHRQGWLVVGSKADCLTGDLGL